MKLINNLFRYLIIMFMAITSLIPFGVLILLSITPVSWKFSEGISASFKFTLSNFGSAWNVSQIGLAIANSLIITIGAVLMIIFLSSQAGYAVARFKNRVNITVFNIFLICMMIPGIINTVPLYTLMRKIGGIDSYWAMILVCCANSLPFAVFLYSSFIKSLPRDIEEAAIIDGCTWFSAFWRVTLPLLKPVTSAVVIISGLSIWNNYAQAVFFLQSQSMRTIPIAISMFFQQYGAKWHLMAASSVIGVAPAIIAFLVFQKYFIKGIAAGSVKG